MGTPLFYYCGTELPVTACVHKIAMPEASCSGGICCRACSNIGRIFAWLFEESRTGPEEPMQSVPIGIRTSDPDCAFSQQSQY